MLWGGGTLQTNITDVCGECSQCLGHTGFAPAHGVCAFPVYTAQAPGCSAGELSKVGPGLRALPRSKPLRFRFSGTPQRHRLGWACSVCPSLVRAVQAARSFGSTLSAGGECILSLPHASHSDSWVAEGAPISSVPCVSSVELISGCSLPGRCHSSPFEDNGLIFWVPDVLCQSSEVVLWNLLSDQMFFR